MSSKNHIPRPFLKWAGGKGKILHELICRIPDHFETYHEPFLGGGALFFELWRSSKIKKAVLSDKNQELVDTYIAIRDYVEDVIRLLSKYPYDKDFYYKIRERNPWDLDLPERAARMIYLNRTCYNGLYRLNKSGKFNVPFGRYKNPQICDADNLRAVSSVLKKTEILCADFSITLNKAKPGDFVYMDPPYTPVSETADFTNYTADGFNWDEQIRLSKVARKLLERGVYVMISNSAVEKIRKLYQGFKIDQIETMRAVNSKAIRRKGWKEFIIFGKANH